MSSLDKILLIYYLAINITLFVFMGYDKLRAKSNSWRVPVATLFTLAIAGGGLGGFAGMFLFRHKTKKPLFYIVFVFAVVIHIALVYFIKDISA